MQSVGGQFIEVAILAIPVASVAWTITHEEVFREPREWCVRNSKVCRTLLARKFFYLFTCEYCFSHWVAAFFVAITGCRLLFDDWRGYLVSILSLVWIANFLMSAYGRLRLDLKKEQIQVQSAEDSRKQAESQPEPTARNEPRMLVRK